MKVGLKLNDVETKIIQIRNEQVILDSDVAMLYGVETKRINEAVKNNPEKFPEEYIMYLSMDEVVDSRSKFSTLKRGENLKYPPKAFTERGLYMLATILKSPVATQTTIAIVNTFAKMRELRASGGSANMNVFWFLKESILISSCIFAKNDAIHIYTQKIRE